jgi:hypothetical protein
MRQKWMEFKAEHLTYFDRRPSRLCSSNPVSAMSSSARLEDPQFRLCKNAFRTLSRSRGDAALKFIARVLPKNAIPAPADRRQRHDGFLAKSGDATAVDRCFP